MISQFTVDYSDESQWNVHAQIPLRLKMPNWMAKVIASNINQSIDDSWAIKHVSLYANDEASIDCHALFSVNTPMSHVQRDMDWVIYEINKQADFLIGILKVVEINLEGD